MTIDRSRRSLLLGAMATAISLNVRAQAGYPVRPVRLVVPYAPGGGVDAVGRILARGAEDLLKQPVIVDNRPGANTIIGTDAVAHSKADGYTLLLATNPHTSNPSLYASVPYDVQKDFAAVGHLGNTPSLICVNPKLGVKTLKGLIDMAKANPGKHLDFATAGLGSAPQIAGEMLALQAGVKFQHIPYKGGGPASADVISGLVPILIAGSAAAIPFVKANSLVALAVTGSSRIAALPDVPTVAESGFPGYQADNWFAVLAPRGTPDAVIDQLNKAFNAAVQTPAVRQQMAGLGVDVVTGTPQEADAFLKDDLQKVGKVIKTAGIKLSE